MQNNLFMLIAFEINGRLQKSLAMMLPPNDCSNEVMIAVATLLAAVV